MAAKDWKSDLDAVGKQSCQAVSYAFLTFPSSSSPPTLLSPPILDGCIRESSALVVDILELSSASIRLPSTRWIPPFSGPSAPASALLLFRAQGALRVTRLPGPMFPGCSTHTTMVLSCTDLSAIVLQLELQLGSRIIAKGIFPLMQVIHFQAYKEPFEPGRAFEIPLVSSIPEQQDKILATVSLSGFICSSYAGLRQAKPVDPRHYLEGVRLVGHRGYGRNRGYDGHLALFENTVLSMEQAQKVGAQGVEFDIQLTKDRVPVVYHDWNVPETSHCSHVPHLLLREFKAMGRRPISQTKRAKDDIDLLKVDPIPAFRLPQPIPKNMAWYFSPEAASLMAVARKRTIHDSFLPTLQELFQLLPKDLCFNVEIKYPSLAERKWGKLEPLDINEYVESILDIVKKYGNGRKVMISSFSEEAVALAALKQNTYPVFYLTSARGSNVTSRVQSLKEACEFAVSFSLAGVVTESTPLIEDPGITREVKREFGVMIASWGEQNNVIKGVQTQVDAGIDVIIVDEVLAISRGVRWS